MMSKYLVLGLLSASSVVLGVEKPGDDPLDWLRDSIPGEPGVDYPIYTTVQETGFSCASRTFGGYYADPAMGCQGYHVCLLDPQLEELYPASFLCPNGTLFSQPIFNCDWWYNVDCSATESYYAQVENAFGSQAGNNNNGGGGGGQCGNVSPLSDNQCSGTISNCWSPGQFDIDCPNSGLCCFDGCANRCVDGPAVDFDTRPAQQTSRPFVSVTTRPFQTTRPVTTRPFQTSRPVTTRPFQTSRPVTSRPVQTSRPIQTTRPFVRPQSTPRPFVTQTFQTRPSRRPAVVTTTGYNYPVPDVTLPVRPITTPRPIVTQPQTLYGAPAAPVRRRGNSRRGRRLRKRKVQKHKKQQQQEQQAQSFDVVVQEIEAEVE